jgi:predicted DNA-binding ribbon-helix-helix protein
VQVKTEKSELSRDGTTYPDHPGHGCLGRNYHRQQDLSELPPEADQRGALRSADGGVGADRQRPAPDLSNAEATEEQLPAIVADKIEPRFRAVADRGGERRGIQLKLTYWNGLGRMSSACKMTTADLLHQTAAQMPQMGNLAFLLPVLSFKWALIRASPSPTILLTLEKKIQLFNDPFLQMLRHRLPMGDAAQFAKSLGFSIDTQIEDAMATLAMNKGKILNAGFTIAAGSQAIKGQINLALAPTHEKPMLIGYISCY